jgi:hypothetical protein
MGNANCGKGRSGRDVGKAWVRIGGVGPDQGPVGLEGLSGDDT